MREGEYVLFEEWYEEYVDSIYKYILLMVKDTQLAEDLTQETFLKVFINQNNFKGNSKVKTWIYRIAYSITMNHFRKKHPITTLFDFVIPIKNTETIVIEQEDVSELFLAISKLKISYKQVIILNKIQQFSIKETASILGWSEGKVKMQLSRGLKALKKIYLESSDFL